jgi:membrane protease subunit (stomatin/prohibitin family)
MQKLRAELIDVIEWVDDSRHTLVWRFPRYHNQIKYGAQLVVRPGQTAIFVRQGRIADVFGPGQYRLETRNLPVLSTLAAWKYGFDSPFMAEVYFVSTRQITDLKWGTPNPVMMRDPDFGPVRVRAFGSYTLRARSPETLLQELVGTDPILDLAASYRDLSEQLRQLVVERIDDEYGLEIPQLWIVNISVPAEVEEALDARTSMNAIGDLAAFQGYQLGQSMPVAAANPAGGLAGAGVGLGMGMAMAAPVLGRSADAPPPPPPPPAAAWHVAENGQTQGPFDRDALARAAAAGRIQAGTLVWTAGMAGWTAAGEVPELAGLFPPPPPPEGTP